ncbi:hypothetical protein SAMN04488038_110107 [Solimonas aquatica]|uniref:Uncharacterized protein n=1 Tax=Solimonas aquatica TaxID=489703 RepID=A0A1H9IMY9_9GAMM|nr:hypothetical protein SAMN04488038_110107 [Solimonas aquatica]
MLNLLPSSTALRRRTYFSLLVQREVSKRKHTPALAPAARVPSLCNVLGAVADTPSLAWPQLSRPSWAALPCARRTAQRQRRGPQRQKPQQLHARSSALPLPLNPLCLAPSSAASAVGEPDTKSGSVAAAPGMARLQRPRAREQRRLPAPRQRRRMRGVGRVFSWVLLFARAKRSTSGAEGRTKPRLDREKGPAENRPAKNSKATAGYGAIAPNPPYGWAPAVWFRPVAEAPPLHAAVRRMARS